MAVASEIALVVSEYQGIQRRLDARSDENDAVREELQAKQSAIAMRLIEMPAASGPDLAQKALVLLDWLIAQDVPSELTASLCEDTVRIFLPQASRRSRQQP